MQPKRFHKILIANRGEISVRIIRACQALNINTVAVYSDADATALYTRLADEAVHIGASSPSTSYLNAEKLIAVAKQVNADAIHPGYGFLAEDTTFAQRCADNHLAFIGPNTKAMRTMASKTAARQLAEKVDVPVLTGYADAAQDTATLTASAQTLGYPLLIKSVAGGGGMGMRVVRDATDFAPMLAAVQQEARTAFGDDTVMLERYLDSARHIEVQIIGDHYGNRIHCYERECSIQRRRQKIVEETPSPFCTNDLTGDIRTRLVKAALKIADAVDYDSLGTVEFLVENTEHPNFYFLEMNTRLQVEHGITELVTGIDLVQEQIRIAQGEPLRYAQADVQLHGHALECRLNAENPRQQFSPTTGYVSAFDIPMRTGTRVDSGIAVGSEATIHYDSLLAKLMSHDVNRVTAIHKMKSLLKNALVLGLTTNQTYLGHVMAHDAFVCGDTTTEFTALYEAELNNVARYAPPVMVWVLAVLHKVTHHPLLVDAKRPQRLYRQIHLSIDGQVESVAVNRVAADSYHLLLGEQSFTVDILSQTDADDLLTLSTATVTAHNEHRQISHSVYTNHQLHIQASQYGTFMVDVPSRFQRVRQSVDAGSYHAAMPGLIIGVHVEVGDRVNAGDTLVVMESMKMESRTLAKQDGVVQTLHVNVGDSVFTGTQLIEIAV